MLKSLLQLTSELLHQNSWWEYRRDEYVLPDGGRGEYFYIRTPGSVFVIPVSADGKLVMLRQFRYLNQRVSLEFVGGGIKQGLSPLENAKHELAEEVGLRASSLHEIGTFNPMNGATDELCHVFVASGLVETIAAPDASEEFEIISVTLEELSVLIRQGQIWDGMTLAAVTLYLEYQKGMHNLL